MIILVKYSITSLTNFVGVLNPDEVIEYEYVKADDIEKQIEIYKEKYGERIEEVLWQ